MHYNDYGSMQRAAQRRVYEMQRRQRAALENNRCTCCSHAPGPEPEPKPEPRQPEPQQPREETASPTAVQQSDPELFLLMAVLALLVSENADPRLIAALLYII